MLSDPVAEAFGLIHRHPSGENFFRVGASSEAINVAASSPGSELCSLRKTLSFERKFISLYLWSVLQLCCAELLFFLCSSAISVRPGDDIYLVLWIRVFIAWN